MISLGIIGGGFSGLAVLAALVRHATHPLQISVYNPDGAFGRGKAYSTQDPEHLLNVRAGAMGAYAGEDDDFFLWLIAEGISCEISDFMPRAVYGRYLDHVLAETLVMAQQKDTRIFMIHERVTDVMPAGQALKVKTVTENHSHDGVILACGNDSPRVPSLGARVAEHAGWWKHPYLPDRWKYIRKAGHVIIIGSGLSMVDALVTLKRENYDGDISVISRHGRNPLPHPASSTAVAWEEADALNIRRLSMLVRQIKLKAAISGSDWRDVLDGLRPYANTIWRNFSPADRARAFRYMSLWNICRHRIPLVMHDLIRNLEGQGQLRRVAAQIQDIQAMGSSLNVRTSAGVKESQIVINCLGYDYKIEPGSNGVLSRLAKSGILSLSEGFPQPASKANRINSDHALYAVGPLLQGYFIESTAVREIRLQADIVAKDILKAV